jgi:hypothetical protein
MNAEDVCVSEHQDLNLYEIRDFIYLCTFSLLFMRNLKLIKYQTSSVFDGLDWILHKP